jgi:hypothetical protein
MFKKMATVLGTTSVLAVTVLCAGSVKAEPQGELLISQLRGHNTYMGEPQLNPTDYVVGRVRGAVGGILSIEFMDPVTVDGKQLMSSEYRSGYTRITADAMPGDDVIFQVVDGKLVYVGKAGPYWITRLKLKSETAVNTNTSQLLEELNQSPRAWGLPALPAESRTYTEAAPMPEPAAAPIRGLW